MSAPDASDAPDALAGLALAPVEPADEPYIASTAALLARTPRPLQSDFLVAATVVYIDAAGAERAASSGAVERALASLATHADDGRLHDCACGFLANVSFFDETGQPTEYTQNCIAFCNDYEAERQRTVGFINLLKELDLFEVKEANHIGVDAEGNAMAPQKIADYFAVSEDKLKALSPEKLAELRDNGALQQIYAHLFSLVNWDRLIAMAISRANQAPA